MRYAPTILTALFASSFAEAREWKDSTGQHSIQAELVRTVEGRVELRRPDGTMVAVPIAKLSAADQQYLKSLEPGRAPAADHFEGNAVSRVRLTPVRESCDNGRCHSSTRVP